MSRDDEYFIGDGQYPNDGGKALQQLWEMYPWSEIKGCPGRYVLKNGVATDKLFHEIAERYTSEELIAKNLIGKACKDQLSVAHFEGGGGLLTYHKKGGDEIHTLNTKSGMLRKLTSLGLHDKFLWGDDKEPLRYLGTGTGTGTGTS